MQAHLEEAVGTLKRRAETALEVGKGQLVHSSGRVLDVFAPVKHAGLQDDDSLVLHMRRVQVQAARSTFAAVLGDGTCNVPGEQLPHVQHIQANFGFLLQSLATDPSSPGPMLRFLKCLTLPSWSTKRRMRSTSKQQTMRLLPSLATDLSSLGVILTVVVTVALCRIS